MPEVSVIVPVYNVEAYLEECLDSILGQGFRDFELIAVDDRSPDGSAKILRRYEREDPRVRVLSLPENVGLGRARNAGLAAAGGRYVWFIDSDDTIAPGSLERIVTRARETDAEVVLFGWVRAYEDGRIEQAVGKERLTAAPPVFSAEEYPDALRVLQVAWNKLIRRDLLERIDLRFPAGLYEDTPFTFPLLAAAKRITAMPDAFVSYRQRSAGAITATTSERHLELLSQWQLALELVDRMGFASEKVRTELFPVMVRHCSNMLMRSERVPVHARREYLRRLSGLYRRFHPRRRYRTRSFAERVQHRIIGLGSLPLLRLHWRAVTLPRPLGKRR